MRRSTAAALEPLAEVAGGAADPALDVWDGVWEVDELRDERDALQARVDELEGRDRSDAGAAAELGALLAEQGISWAGDLPRTTARVIAGPGSNFSHTLEIDRGSRSGLSVGLVVVSGAGLVGRLAQVTADRSIVQLVTDPALRVGTRLLPDCVLGTARGAGDGRPLRVDTGLRSEVRLAPGEQVVTSGGGDSPFPPSIPIGVVRGTEPAANGLTLDLQVEPFVDPARTAFVTVLLRDGDG